MAYPIVSAPYGFKPINRFDGIAYAGATNQYPVTSGQAVYNGQVVAFVTGGTVSPVADLTDDEIYAVGVCVGVQYVNSMGQTVQAQYAPASATNVIAYVVNDPAAEFKVAVVNSSGVITPVAGTILNSNVTGYTGTGNDATGDINSGIDGSTADSDNKFLFRVTGLVPETIDPATGDYTEVVVKFNGSWHQQVSTLGTAPA